MNIGNCSLCSWIIIPTLGICGISPDLIGLPSMTSTCDFSFHSSSGIWWWPAKSWFINSMPGAPQSISVCVDISWLFTIHVQVITKCFPSIDPCNISTLLTDKREIPKRFKTSKTELFLWADEPSFFSWHNLFLISPNLSRFLFPLLPLQPPWMSESSSMLCILPPCC